MGILDFTKTTESKPSPDQKQKILVVDDDQYLREFYEELLLHEDYDVSTVSNGKEALASVDKNKPDLVLLDIIMPEIDGNEVLKRLWNNAQTKNIPVIVLTNAGNMDNMDKAKFYSAYKFLIKSNITPDQILTTVKRALQKNKDDTADIL